MLCDAYTNTTHTLVSLGFLSGCHFSPSSYVPSRWLLVVPVGARGYMRVCAWCECARVVGMCLYMRVGFLIRVYPLPPALKMHSYGVYACERAHICAYLCMYLKNNSTVELKKYGNVHLEESQELN